MPNEIAAALIAIGGVVIAGILQCLVTLLVIRSERRKLSHQLAVEFRNQHFTAWQQRFQELVAKLLAATDLETNPTPNRKEVVPLIHALQLMLNPQDPKHAEVNSLINELGLRVNGWKGQPDLHAVLGAQSNLLEAARSVMYVPSRTHVV